ncbi:MAG: DNA translocase FtsK [Candidatus Pacebacteria bacterium]|nr:DNA translocase FtsK [Candidatus Paceibacterota bacterium]
MSRRKKRLKKERYEDEEREKWSFLHPETKKLIVSIILFVTSIILILSAFGSSGPAGNLIFSWLSYLFGFGFYLFPIAFLLISIILITSGHEKILSPTLFGGIVFIISGLGFIDLILPGKGGLSGNLAGMIEIPFGFIAALLISVAILLSSLIFILNLPILSFFRRNKNNQTEEKLTNQEMKKITEAEKDTKSEKESKEEIKEEEKDLEVKEPIFSVFKKKVKKIDFKNYVPPPLSLLKSSNEKATAGDLRLNANIIKRTFESFNIPVEMGEINVGPKVTRYTLKPAEGVKLSKIVALSQDLALALAAHPIRIEAPIPGRSLVGVEVPNKVAAIVRLGNLLSTSNFEDLSPLSVILGRDVTGEPIDTDIDKMPHMLIAGSTGSGKSVTLHSIIISLLYKNSPENLRFIFIDPKRVELSVYEGIPHLVAPVVIQNKKAVGVFRWAISEMEKRYEILHNSGARDIKSYNEKISKSKEGEKMPYLLITVDELADLMSSFGKEVEGYIIRLSQMARAVGIHLILATQRPSVEVITGLIKANITTRVALKVASQIDSRTILDTSGAEKLLGQGDMLLISPTFSKPKRIQSPLVTEDEIQEIANFIRENNKEITDEIAEGEEKPEFEKSKENSDEKEKIDKKDLFDNFETSGDEDDMLEEAIETVKQAQKASASLLQRRLKVGYARAARLLDIMEEKGIIGPGEGAKPREVFLGNEGDSRFGEINKDA